MFLALILATLTYRITEGFMSTNICKRSFSQLWNEEVLIMVCVVSFWESWDTEIQLWLGIVHSPPEIHWHYWLLIIYDNSRQPNWSHRGKDCKYVKIYFHSCFSQVSMPIKGKGSIVRRVRYKQRCWGPGLCFIHCALWHMEFCFRKEQSTAHRDYKDCV